MYPRVDRVKLVNYRSIGRCSVSLDRITVLVGPNGAGKSNFVDALRFVRDGLRTTLGEAVRARGGMRRLRRASTGHPSIFTIRVELRLDEEHSALYAVSLEAERKEPGAGFSVRREKCAILRFWQPSEEYVVERGQLVRGDPRLPRTIEDDRLYLTLASALPAFRPVYDALAGSGFYDLDPRAMRALQDPDPGELLAPDGANASSVLRRMEQRQSWGLRRLRDYLRRAVPGVDGVASATVGPKETFDFWQEMAGSKNDWRFPAAAASDGTLRLVGGLLAAFQGAAAPGGGGRVPLVAIEQPEAGMHPAAVRLLTDALIEAARHRQIIVTSHSPELLDHPALGPRQLRAVTLQAGETTIATLDEGLRAMIEERLATPGELLRQARLEPSKAANQAATQQLEMFRTPRGEEG